MVRAAGLEPTTPAFQAQYSTAELRHTQLEVQGYLTSDPAADSGSDVQLQLWDWRASKWVTANPKLTQSFRQGIAEPAKYIMMPCGLVRARVNHTDSSHSPYDSPELTWIDIAYQGEAVKR